MKGTVSFFKLIQGLTGNGSKLVIDEYQRHYVWTKERTINLLKTIISANEKVFIGTFTIFAPDSSEVQVVDGQQRLVTIYIIMKCLRDIMIENRETYDKIFAVKNNHVTVQYLERAYDDLIDDKYSGEFKLSFRKKDTEDDFDAVIRNNKPSKYKNSQIEKNYNAIKNYLLENKPEVLCDAYLHLLNTVECCSMECDSQIEAYRTFASINGLGQKVEDKYSIINIIFQHLGLANKDVCNLIEDADKSFMNRFLFNKTGKWVGRNDVISNFTNYIEGKNPEKVVEDILSFGEFDQQCKIYRDAHFLMPIPAMWVVLNYLKSSKFEERDILQCAKKFSAIFMRMQVCPGVCHVSEGDVAKTLSKISKVEDVSMILSSTADDEHGRFFYPKDDKFKECLKTIDVYHSPILKNYVLQAINNELSDCEQFVVQDMSVEHILPQRDNKNNPLLHRIGNLTLTDAGKNSSMGVKDFNKKKEILANSVYVLNRYFENVNEWTDDEILKRSEYLSDIAAKIWSIDN